MKCGVFGSLVGMALFTCSGAASAQPDASDVCRVVYVDSEHTAYFVEFTDDALNAVRDGVIIPRITVRPGAARTLLLRPHASFVPEMLKSVERI